MPVDEQLARPAVVGVQPVALPRVVAEHEVRTGGADQRADPLDGAAVGRRARRRPRPRSGRRRHRGSGPPPVAPPGGRRPGRRGRRGIPRALRAVGEDRELDVGAGACPLRQRRPAPELDVVGMRADRQHARRDQPRCGHGAGVASRSAASSTRSSGTSTSNARSRSRTTRSPSPSRRASAACRRNEPGP